MKSVLILTSCNPATNPRPRRMIDSLMSSFSITALGIGAQDIDGVEVHNFSEYKKRNFFGEILLYFNIFFGLWNKLIYTKNRLEVVDFMEARAFDCIICFDLALLPIALKYKKNAKVIFDAQEYYPLWFTSSFRWRILFARFYDFLSREYMPLCDCVLTVSDAFRERYFRDYNVKCEVFLSLPYFYDLPPKPPIEDNIKIIYHGSLSRNRSIDEVVKLASMLDSRFSMDLILVGGDSGYREYIQSLVDPSGARVRILPPVGFFEIIPFCNSYDVGLYFMPPKTYNLSATIPNKFFEYIGSSLAIATTPNESILPFVEKYKNATVSKDFSIEQMSKSINSLNLDDIKKLKNASYLASCELNIEKNKEKILDILGGLK